MSPVGGVVALRPRGFGKAGYQIIQWSGFYQTLIASLTSAEIEQETRSLFAVREGAELQEWSKRGGLSVLDR